MVLSFVDSQWQQRLEKAGLDSLDRLLKCQDGEVLSEHRRGRTCRVRLEDGSVVFVKTDNFTYFKQVCKDLFAFRAPIPNSVRERQAYELLAAQGFRVPQVVAWYFRKCCGYPGAAAMITLPVAGKPLDKFLKEHSGDAEKCQAAIQAVYKEFQRMLQCGYDWRDHKPEHFFVDDELNVSLIDVERMELRARQLPQSLMEARLAKFLRQAAACK